MRPLTSGTTVQVNQALGSEPVLVIKIEWGGGTGNIYYTDKATTIAGLTVQGRIIDASPINNILKDVGLGTVSAISVTFDDTISSTPSFKTLIDTVVLEGKFATVYHWYEGGTSADLVPLLRGKLTSPIVWSEGGRTLRTDIVSVVEDGTVSYQPQVGDLANLLRTAVDKSWPLAFGSVINVPAPRVTGSAKGTLYGGVTSALVAGQSFIVTGGNDFTQGTPIDIIVGTTRYSGSFAGEIFTITAVNVPKYTNVAFDARPGTDADNADARVAWIKPLGVNIAGMHCYIGTLPSGSTLEVPQVNFCYKQVGQKCWFVNTWHATGGAGVLVSDIHLEQIDQACSVFRDVWSTALIIWKFGFNWEFVTTVVRWWWNAGTEVREYGVSDVYVANLIPSTLVLDVKAYRTVEGQSSRQLMSLPAAYYTVNLSNSLAGRSPTTITLSTNLGDRNEGWDDTFVFVTLRSTQGPNTSDILKFLITHNTSLSADATTFAAVATAIAKYPSHFAFLDNRSVMKAIDEVAWQARCAVRVDGVTASIVYLGTKPSPITFVVDESIIENKEMHFKFTDATNLFTQMTAKWKINYTDPVTPQNAGTPTANHTYTPTILAPAPLSVINNVSLFGIHKVEWDFYIYNIQSLVQKSLNFWAHRYSNVFRKVSGKTILKSLPLELFDPVNMTLMNTSMLPSLPGYVEEILFDTGDHSIGLSIYLACIAGTVIEDTSFWQNDSADVLPADPTIGIVPVISNIITAQTNSGGGSNYLQPADIGASSGGGGSGGVPSDSLDGSAKATKVSGAPTTTEDGITINDQDRVLVQSGTYKGVWINNSGVFALDSIYKFCSVEQGTTYGLKAYVYDGSQYQLITASVAPLVGFANAAQLTGAVATPCDGVTINNGDRVALLNGVSRGVYLRTAGVFALESVPKAIEIYDGTVFGRSQWQDNGTNYGLARIPLKTHSAKASQLSGAPATPMDGIAISSGELVLVQTGASIGLYQYNGSTFTLLTVSLTNKFCAVEQGTTYGKFLFVFDGTNYVKALSTSIGLCGTARAAGTTLTNPLDGITLTVGQRALRLTGSPGVYVWDGSGFVTESLYLFCSVSEGTTYGHGAYVFNQVSSVYEGLTATYG